MDSEDIIDIMSKTAITTNTTNTTKTPRRYKHPIWTLLDIRIATTPPELLRRGERLDCASPAARSRILATDTSDAARVAAFDAAFGPIQRRYVVKKPEPEDPELRAISVNLDRALDRSKR